MSGALRARTSQLPLLGSVLQARDASRHFGGGGGGSFGVCAWLQSVAAQLSACSKLLQHSDPAAAAGVCTGRPAPARGVCSSAATATATSRRHERCTLPFAQLGSAAASAAVHSGRPSRGGGCWKHSTGCAAGAASAGCTADAARAAPFVEHGPVRRRRVVAAAVSGGVDSAVAASMMQQAGHEVSEI